MAAHIDTVHWYSPSVHPEKIAKKDHWGWNPRPPACEADVLTNRATASSAMTAAVKIVLLYYLLSCIPTSTRVATFRYEFSIRYCRLDR